MNSTPGRSSSSLAAVSCQFILSFRCIPSSCKLKHSHPPGWPWLLCLEIIISQESMNIISSGQAMLICWMCVQLLNNSFPGSHWCSRLSAFHVCSPLFSVHSHCLQHHLSPVPEHSVTSEETLFPSAVTPSLGPAPDHQEPTPCVCRSACSARFPSVESPCVSFCVCFSHWAPCPQGLSMW